MVQDCISVITPALNHSLVGKANQISGTAPEWIRMTDKPYRTNRFTYGYSSQYEHYWKAVFGNMAPITSKEYNEDAGLPNRR